MKQQTAKYFVFVLFLCALTNAWAQTFSFDEAQPQQAPLPARPGGASASSAVENPRVIETDATIEEITKSFAQKKVSAQEADGPLSELSKAFVTTQNAQEKQKDNEDSAEDSFIPEGELYRLDTPTKDGSSRGGQSFVEIDSKGRMKKSTKIFLFYDRFKMLNTSAQTPLCNVRFNILSTLDYKISQLDIKLVWPDLTTTLSFSNVLPNTQTYYDYALLSKGCYNMDKAPNIIVNRCRVKSLTAAECADKLIWLSK